MNTKPIHVEILEFVKVEILKIYYFREPTHFWGAAAHSALSDKMKWRPLTKKQASGEFPARWWRIDNNPGYASEPYKERMKFWDELYEQYFIPFFSKSNFYTKKKTEL